MKNSDKSLPLDAFDLIYGIGNVGREDDGLGWAFIDAIEAEKLSDAQLVRHYQLFFEDVDLVRRHQRVLFVDATKADTSRRFAMERVAPRLDDSFTSHAISVQSIVAMCHQCYGVYPDIWLLTIKGYSWELSEGLTKKAQANLYAALNAVQFTGVEETDTRPALERVNSALAENGQQTLTRISR